MAAKEKQESEGTVSGLVAFLQQWTNDILAHVFPGYLLILMLVGAFGAWHLLSEEMRSQHEGLPNWLPAALSIGVAYFGGHLLLAFGRRMFAMVALICSRVRGPEDWSDDPLVWAITRPWRGIQTEDEIVAKIAKRRDFEEFRKLAIGLYGVDVIGNRITMEQIRVLRNLAVRVDTGIVDVTTKFTFLSILCQNLATLAVLTAAVVAFTPTAAGISRGWLMAVLIYVAYLFLLTAGEHYRRSLTTPFGAAVVALRRKTEAALP